MNSVFAQKIDKLPNFLQEHLLEYIDFLYLKYVEENIDSEISDKGKKILDTRWEEYLNNLEKVKPWSQFKKELKVSGKSI